VREEDAGERKAGAHSTTPTYTAGKDSPAREPSWSAFWLQKPSVLRVCVREEDAGERKAISVRLSKHPLMVRTFLKVHMELGSYFLFLQEQIKDIIIICLYV
jgi:hypothetical protein